MTIIRASYSYNLYEQYFAITESQAEYTSRYFRYSEMKVSVHLVPDLKMLAPPGNCWVVLPPTPAEDAQHFADSVLNNNLVLEKVFSTLWFYHQKKRYYLQWLVLKTNLKISLQVIHDKYRNMGG